MLRVVDLLNRYCNGRRCREAISEVIMLLALFNCGKKIVCSVRFSKKKCPIRDVFFLYFVPSLLSILYGREAATELVVILVLLCLRGRRLCLRKAFAMLELFVAQDICVYDTHLQAVKIFRINTELQRYLKGFVLYWQYKHIYCRRKFKNINISVATTRNSFDLFQNPKRVEI